MSHLIQPAPTARAKCRGCGERIAAGKMRFGEALPNPFAEGETIHWFHPTCAAFKRPEPFLATLETGAEPLENRDWLAAEAKRGIEYRRLARLNGAERSPSGQAECRSCRARINKGAWRISLVFYEEGRFSPSGFIHPACAQAYFETADVLQRLKHFSPRLSDEELREIEAELRPSAA